MKCSMFHLLSIQLKEKQKKKKILAFLNRTIYIQKQLPNFQAQRKLFNKVIQ